MWVWCRRVEGDGFVVAQLRRRRSRIAEEKKWGNDTKQGFKRGMSQMSE